MPEYLVEINDADEPEGLGCGSWVLLLASVLGLTALAFAGGGAAVVVLLVGVFAVRLVIKLVFKK